MNSISPISQGSFPFASLGQATPATSGGFADALGAARAGVLGVNALQNESAEASRRLALGETDDVIGTLATVEKADLALKTLLAVRSKLMTAFDEIRNMPV